MSRSSLTRDQWETVLEDVESATFGDLVAALEELDLVPGDPAALVEAAVDGDGPLVEDESATGAFPEYRLDSAESGGSADSEPRGTADVDATPTPDEGQTDSSDADSSVNGENGVPVDLQPAPEIETDAFPTDLEDVTQWLAWRATDDGRKVPRAPYENPDWPDKFVSAQDPDVWRDFETVTEWCEKLAGYEPAFNIRDREKYPGEEYVLIDYDDARDPETGEIHPTVREHIERAGSYADVSTSGTGVHIFCRGGLPEGVKAIEAELPEDDRFPGGEIEVYDSARFSAMTGDRIAGTPEYTVVCQTFIENLADEYATVAEGTPDQLLEEPEKSRDEIADVETTTEIQDVLDAIQHTGPRDIRLRSKVTHERGDGSKSLDPAWASSKSGTRLAQVDDGWVYRKGMHGLDALQVVALEERIITTVDEYPSGEDFWEAVEALRQRGAHIPEYERDDSPLFDAAREDDEEIDPQQVAALPLPQLDALDPDDRRRAAQKRGLDWPTTDEARDRLRDRIIAAMRHQEDVVVDAPTALGKTHTVATESWLNLADVTDESPVVHFSGTTEARNKAASKSHAATGVTTATLKGRRERCPVAAGDHDPAETDEEDDPDIVVTLDGIPASLWFDAVCDGRGVPFSTAHAYLAEHHDQHRDDLPCCEGGVECPAKAQWDGVPRDSEGDPGADIIHATHQFARVPGLVNNCNVVFDERPDFALDLPNDRIQRAVSAFLDEIGTPVSTWEGFVMLAQHDGAGGDAAAERDATERKLNETPDREWYLQNPDAHTVAPALARALWYAFRSDADENERRSATVPHRPPRLDGEVHDDEGWNRVWVTVVVDDDNRIRSVRGSPDLSLARCVIGLDAHPAAPLWQRNTKPGITVDRILDADERRLWRRYERGLTVVQVGEHTHPAGKDGRYLENGERGTRAVIEQLRQQYGDNFRTGITAKSAEGHFSQLLEEVGVDDPETMHFGEEKSRGDFGGEDIGLVNGCIDPGDGYILDLLAEADLDARPEMEECQKCGGQGCAGDPDCHDGQRRAHGREFVGEDAEAARVILASVRENHVAQAAGRYARNADDLTDTATVFVRTDALPPGFADLQVPGVEWVATDTQRRIVEELRDRGSATARDLAEATDASKRHVSKTLARLAEAGTITARRGAGAHGATVYGADDPTASGVVNLGAEEIANGGVWGSYTWSFAISQPDSPLHEGGNRQSYSGASQDADPPKLRLGIDDFETG